MFHLHFSQFGFLLETFPQLQLHHPGTFHRDTEGETQRDTGRTTERKIVKCRVPQPPQGPTAHARHPHAVSAAAAACERAHSSRLPRERALLFFIIYLTIKKATHFCVSVCVCVSVWTINVCSVKEQCDLGQKGTNSTFIVTGTKVKTFLKYGCVWKRGYEVYRISRKH